MRCRPVLSSVALAVSLGTLPAAATTLFTDLAASNPVYNTGASYSISGSTSPLSENITQGFEFQITGSGNFQVTQIDLGVEQDNAPNTFNASIWTVGPGKPGTQIAGALWTGLTTANTTCCALNTISGISGVTLVGGTSYFLILSPTAPAGTSEIQWEFNNQSVNGDRQLSFDDGATWNDDQGSNTMGAFDVLGTAGSAVPEPGTMVLLGLGWPEL